MGKKAGAAKPAPSLEEGEKLVPLWDTSIVSGIKLTPEQRARVDAKLYLG